MLTFESDRFRDVELHLPTGHFYRGRSVGGEETCHQFPGLDLCFDIGYAPMSATSISRVFITHGHADHAGGMARHATRRHGRKLAPATYYVPECITAGTQALFDAMMMLEGSPRSGKIIAVEAKPENPYAPADSKRDPFKPNPDHVRVLTEDRSLTAFPAKHRIPCFGYLVSQTRKRLRSDLKGASQEQIKALARSGENLNEYVIVPDIAYCGDTLIDVLKEQPDVRQARLLILECTMLEGSVSVEDTRRAGHIHLDEIINEPELLAENECVLLTHFSARYRTQEIRDILDRRLPDSLKEKIIPLLPSSRAPVV